MVSTSAPNLFESAIRMRAANARLDIFFGGVGRQSLEERRQRVVELGEQLADGDGFKADAEVRGQLPAVVDGAGRRIRAGHADADHVFRAECISGDGRHQR